MSCYQFLITGLLFQLLNSYSYSVTIFSYSDRLEIFHSEGKQYTAEAGARGHENCCTLH